MQAFQGLQLEKDIVYKNIMNQVCNMGLCVLQGQAVTVHITFRLLWCKQS